MSRYLRELLAATEPAFSQAIREFESATGNQGTDITLSTDIERQAQTAIKHLGLDHRDITSQEIYHALQGLARRHDEFLATVTGRPNLADPAEVAMVLGEVFYKLGLNQEAWVLKTSVMRRLLKNNPPRMVMKRLGYRSVDSMVKRENASELLLGARMLESSAWTRRLLKSYKQLKASDFETRTVQIIALDQKRWQTAFAEFRRQKQLNVAHSKELGALGVIPVEGRPRPGMTTLTYLLAIHYLNEIKSYSTYFKLKQVDGKFGELVSRTLLYDPAEAVEVLGRPVHWKSLRRHFARSGIGAPDAFQPHLSDEDMSWTTAEELLYRLEPALKYWDGLEAVGLPTDGKPLSFNLMDNTVSLVNVLDYGSQAVGHMQAALGNEVLSRYLAKKQLEDHVMSQLEPAGANMSITSFLEEEEFSV